MKAKITLALIVMISTCCLMTSIGEARVLGPFVKAHDMRAVHRDGRPFPQLNLSDTQKNEIKNIVLKYREEQKVLRDSLRDQTKDFSDLLRLETFNEEEARKNFQKVSAVREDMFVLQIKMRMEIKGVLTPEQLEWLKTQRIERLERIHREVGNRLERFEK